MALKILQRAIFKHFTVHINATVSTLTSCWKCLIADQILKTEKYKILRILSKQIR